MTAAEVAKRRLSRSEETTLSISRWAPPGRSAYCWETKVTREFAEKAWQPLLDRLRRPVARALGDAGLRPADVDRVLLVGGSSRMPAFRSLVAEIFDQEPSAQAQLKFHPRDALPNTAALDRAEALYQDLRGMARDRLGEAIHQFRAVLEGQDDDEIERLREALLQLVVDHQASS